MSKILGSVDPSKSLLDSPLYSSTIRIYGFPLKKNFKKI